MYTIAQCHAILLLLIQSYSKSKWGLHFRVITDILVLQFPIWYDTFLAIYITVPLTKVYLGISFNHWYPSLLKSKVSIVMVNSL